jgi:AraC-like DNA-binding protein
VGFLSNEKVSLAPEKRQIRFMRVKDLPGVELYQGIEVTQLTSRHVHLVFALTIGEAGVGIHQTTKGNFVVTPGNIILTNYGESHSSETPAGFKFSSRTIRIDQALLERLLSQITGHNLDRICLPQPVINDKDLALSLLHLHSVLSTSTDKLEKECRILDVLAELYAHHVLKEPVSQLSRHEYAPVRHVCEYIKDCYFSNISLNELAGIAGFSPFYLTKVFTKQIGVSPHEYHLQIRLKKATDLLALGKSPAEVAFEVGFCDQSHFYKAFKKKFGVTPGQYER